MPTLTEGAARFLEGALHRAQRPGAAVRLARSGSAWSLQIDGEKEGDEVLEREGQALLVMADEVAEALGDAVIDLHETGRGPRLVITQE